MKRLVFALFVLGVSSSASAQPDACSIMFAGKYFKPAATALDQVATMCNYESPVFPSTADIPNQIVNLDGKSFESINEAVAYILAGVPFSATVDTIKHTITIRRKGPESSTGSSALVPTEPRLALQTPRRQETVYEPPTPVAVPQDSYQAYITQKLSSVRAQAGEFLARNSWNGYNGPTGYGSYNGVVGSFDPNEYLGHAYIQRQIDDNELGGVKFKKGDERLMESIELWGCGKRITTADEANNIWDHVIRVPVNCVPLTFRYSDGKDDWEVEIPEMIFPSRVMREKDITIDKKFFERARNMTVHRKYTMIEQPDGSFLRVPREEDTTGKPVKR